MDQTALMPQLRTVGRVTQLHVDDRPFLVLGGELGNSTASDLRVLDAALARCRRMNLNTVMLPVYWDLLEPREGQYDFPLVRAAVDRARELELRLVYLWFATWKNSMSCYAPCWVKRDHERFARTRQRDGRVLEIISPASAAARDAALQNGAAVAYDPSEPDIAKRIIRETEGGFDGVVDFAGNEKSMAFAVSVLARGGKIVVSGLMGGNFSLPMVQWVYKRMTIEGFMVGTLAEGQELMALARAGKIKPTPMREEPMADVQKWIDALRAGQVVGRIMLKNES